MQPNKASMNHSAKERIYVAVNSDIDTTGYLQPKEIIWEDGRVFPIEQITAFRPAATCSEHTSGDCYLITVHGKEKILFFERTDPIFQSRIGRWFIEVDGSEEFPS